MLEFSREIEPTGCVCVCVCVCVCARVSARPINTHICHIRGWWWKELAHVIKESEKSQDLQQHARHQGELIGSASQKASKLETPKTGKDQCPTLAKQEFCLQLVE